LRTPLNSAINFLTCAIQDDGNFEDVKEDLIIPAIHSLKMQSYFINDIIDLSQIYVNNFKVSYSEFTLRELITEITNIFKI
jgi:signal transduction histidine kinase